MKESLSETCGGTDARGEDVRERIAGITGVGLDYVVETTGGPEMGTLAAEVLAPLGTAGRLGTPKPGVKIPLDPFPILLGGRSVRGIVQGDAIPQLFMPRLIRMLQAEWPGSSARASRFGWLS